MNTETNITLPEKDLGNVKNENHPSDESSSKVRSRGRLMTVSLTPILYERVLISHEENLNE